MPEAGQGSNAMQLFYVAGSPYARMVRMALAERGIALPQVETTLRDPASGLLPHNPVGRVPTLLLDDGTALTETLIILPYLDGMHGGAPIMPPEPPRLAVLGRAMGMLDGIAVWNRELRRPVHERSPSVLALEETRANRVADAFEHDLSNLDRIDACWLALTAALGYCERRHTVFRWREGRPRLAAWLDAAAERASFQATLPPPSGI